MVYRKDRERRAGLAVVTDTVAELRNEQERG